MMQPGRAGGRTSDAGGSEAAQPALQGEALSSLQHLRVHIGRDTALAFQQAAGGPVSERHIPLTFPFCFLTLPSVRGLILSMIGGEGVVPVHEAQSFFFLRRLEIGTDYDLDVELSRSDKPPRLHLNATVATVDGVPCTRLETVLRIVSVAPLAEAEN